MCEQRAQVKQTTSHHLGCLYAAPHRFFSLFLFFKICIYNTLAHTSTLLCLLLINYSRMPHRHIKWCDFFSSSAVALLFSVISGSAFLRAFFRSDFVVVLFSFSRLFHIICVSLFIVFSLFSESVCALSCILMVLSSFFVALLLYFRILHIMDAFIHISSRSGKQEGRKKNVFETQIPNNYSRCQRIRSFFPTLIDP